MVKFKYLAFIGFILGTQAFSHPVIYKSGWVYQASFMPKMNEMTLGYTFHPNFAVALNSNRFENNNEYQDYTVGMNALVKRWLNHDSQGNLYVGAHAGYYEDNQRDGFAAHAFLMADWEDREDYFLFKSKNYYYDSENSQDYMARYGFAPYVAGMDELQTWMIFQAYYYERQSKEVIVTPMLRFFYKNVLWEVGSSLKGDSFITLMVHY